VRPTLHLVPEAAWEARDRSQGWLPAAYANDGFVHCTDGDAAMIEVANRFYAADPRPFLVLTVDLDRTGSPWRFDDLGQPYPHVYGPIDLGAVLETRRIIRDPGGRFVAIVELEASADRS
jgi:uncharacterized protein (DUF952 family)